VGQVISDLEKMLI